MENGKWETGDGRRETGNGRREMGDGRRETEDGKRKTTPHPPGAKEAEEGVTVMATASPQGGHV